MAKRRILKEETIRRLKKLIKIYPNRGELINSDEYQSLKMFMNSYEKEHINLIIDLCFDDYDYDEIELIIKKGLIGEIMAKKNDKEMNINVGEEARLINDTIKKKSTKKTNTKTTIKKLTEELEKENKNDTDTDVKENKNDTNEVEEEIAAMKAVEKKVGKNKKKRKKDKGFSTVGNAASYRSMTMSPSHDFWSIILHK